MQRRIQSLVRQIGCRVEYSYNHSSAFSSLASSSRLTSSLLADVASSQKLWSPPSSNFMRPFYSYLQHLSISSTRELSADASEQAVPSPLTPLLTSSGGSEETAKVVKKTGNSSSCSQKDKTEP
ncbi:unnamed protein product [Rhodiola kirilowii]